jgi:hypothetical protein
MKTMAGGQLTEPTAITILAFGVQLQFQTDSRILSCALLYCC